MSDSARVGLFSQRNLLKDFCRCGNYEWENVILDVDDVELIAPHPAHSETRRQRWQNRLAERVPFVSYDPGIDRPGFEREYDLFFTTSMFIGDMKTFDALKGWRERSRIAVCYLTEFWVRDIPNRTNLLKTLAEFDYVFLNFNETVEPLSEAIGKPCFYVMPGVDTMRFCPYPNPVERVVDVYSMGRRAPAMHEALLRRSEAGGQFYLYDTNTGDWKVRDFREHRQLCISLIQRSRYFVVNPAKMDSKQETGGQLEFGYRFFEGAAGGAVMIGRPVDTDLFRKAFDWKDAVLSIPGDGSDITSFLDQLDADPDRLEQTRRNNVQHCLRRHDWAYRWEEILGRVGLEARPQLADRKERLESMARRLEEPATPQNLHVEPEAIRT